MAAGWKNIPRSSVCPICARRGGYCTIAPKGDAIQCMRVESSKPVKRKDGTVGYLHPVPGEAMAMAKALPSSADKPKISPKKWEQVIKKYRSAISDKRLRATADELGVSPESLIDIRIGLDVGCDWWRGTGDPCFPMFDGKQDPIGIRTRTPDMMLKPGRDRYGCVVGSSNGLFIPESYEVVPIPPGLCGVQREGDADEYPLLLCPEGPTNIAALRDMGFRTIGRPSASGGAPMLHALLLNGKHKQDVVIIQDHDTTKYNRDGTPFWPGEEGALKTAQHIYSACGLLRITEPPDNIKDVRKWFNAGGQADVLRAVIEQKAFIRPEWIEQQIENLRQYKARMTIRKAG